MSIWMSVIFHHDDDDDDDGACVGWVVVVARAFLTDDERQMEGTKQLARDRCFCQSFPTSTSMSKGREGSIKDR
jgi:hypothetical protein